jgi:hypothetical protein
LKTRMSLVAAEKTAQGVLQLSTMLAPLTAIQV